MRVGFNVNERDPAKVKARDEQLIAFQRAKDAGQTDKQLIAFRVPGFTAGFIATDPDVRGRGDVFPQSRVRSNGREGLFDDMAGRGFMIVSRGGDAEATLSPADRQFWRDLGGRFVEIAAGGGNREAVSDLDGRILRLMDGYGCDVVVKRPDYYLFGACPTLHDLPGLLADLRLALQRGAAGI
jgi:hypothetical protein